MLWRIRLAGGAGVLAITIASVAEAQPRSDEAVAAQKLFDEGLSLMKTSNFAAACPKLEESQKRDPAMGTEYRLAECYEKAGWLAQSWKLYMRVANEAHEAGRKDREAQAREHADGLKKRVPMMTIFVPEAVASVSGLEVKVDGEVLPKNDWNHKVPVDPGAHTIVAAAPGWKTSSQTVRALEGASVDVPLLALTKDGAGAPAPAAPVIAAPAAVAPPPPVAPPVAPAPPVAAAAPPPVAPDATSGGGSGQRIAAVAVGVVGIAGLAVGGIFGAGAKSKWNDALSHCAGGDKAHCDATGVDLGNKASTSATISTVGFIAGGVGLAAAGVLWFTAPSGKPGKAAALRFVPVLGPQGAAGFAEGSF